MSFKEIIFSLKFYLKTISRKLIPSILSSFGALWLFTEIGTYFLGETSPIIIDIKKCWFIFIFIGLLIAIILAKPIFTIGGKLNNRDISIEITIGDFFKQNGGLVISSNTTYDTHISKELISEKSIQGQFTKLFYYGDEKQLDNDISLALQDIQPEILIGKRIGKNKKYPIGTTVRLNPKNQTVYMLAIANINEYGVASASYEDLKVALACLWLFIGSRGLKENIVIPVVGTGFARLPKTREEIIREIIKSFIAACSESTFSDKLTIVINPSDYEKHKINIDELEKYIVHLCRYTLFSNNTDKNGHQI
ncbi:macro domain-containing protein [Treponema sp. R80B11-R83G3]